MAENRDSTRQVLSFIPASLNPNAIMFNHSMGSKIKDICGRLEQLCHERIELRLQRIPGSVGTSSASAAQQRPPSSSVPTERAVYGRDKDKARILKMVLSTDEKTDDDANFRVIPIVGMAGVGKTTLAREVYNDKSLNAKDFKFDIKAWVCISDVFDVLSISKALLESITRKPCHLNTLNEVQVDLKTVVDGKRFLLVLDDVWNEDYSLWVDLKAPLLAAAPNSKMIITTRHSHVASTMGPIKHYNLKRLLDEDCWSIFIKHAYESRSLKAHQISELFRKKVVGKCGGLPLAAKSLGGLLHWKRNLFNILTAKGSKYVLTQPCPPEPSLYDYRNQREPYEKWCEANKMAKRYILASISMELHKKHRSMETATEIMASLHQMFGQNTHFAREAALKCITDTKMEEGTKEEQQQPADQNRIILEQSSLLEPRRSGRVTRLPARCMFLGETYTAISDKHVQDPTSYNETLIDRDVEF
ncbi:putative disease resistance protein RGA1 [Citrus clementina]|uniref:putative disease resistance protein RGA1 n=1 Tax=Citrus clementina TaxID=85681 RepID=UPI000CED5B17|nr:putative disease resistance protein RGA1 [Citrus x clementina]